MKIPRNNAKFYDGTFDQKKYIQQYNKVNYDKLQLQFRKDNFMLDLINIAMAKHHMQSRTEYIKKAIEEKLERDGIDIAAMRELFAKQESSSDK